MAELTKTMGRVEGILEETNQFWYDRLQITSTTTSLTYFQTPMSGSKSKLYTNMTQAGVLPVPKMMRVFVVRFALDSACLVGDAKYIVDGSYMEFWVNDKIAIEGPVGVFSQGMGVTGTVATTANNTTKETALNGIADSRSIFVLKHSIDIGVQTPFRIELHIPTALSSLSASTYAMFMLEGETWRGVS